MTKLTPPKILAVLGIMFAGYLIFSSFMDWPWDRREDAIVSVLSSDGKVHQYHCVFGKSCNFTYMTEKWQDGYRGMGLPIDKKHFEFLSKGEVDEFYLSRAQDACREEGGEWDIINESELGIIIVSEGCKLSSEEFPYQNHTLQGFDEYKALKNAKEVCSRNGGEFFEDTEFGIESQLKMEGKTLNGSHCVVKGEYYLLNDGRLLREDELK